MLHISTVADDCLVRNAWICPTYVTTRGEEITGALVEHVWIVVLSVVLGTVLAFPLALAARRSPTLSTVIMGASTAVYAIPSLALFSLLLPFTGLSAATVVTGLVLYSLTILVRGIVAGLAGVSDDVLDAARGMGFDGRRLLWQVEMPLALPTIFAALRVATVSTVAMTTIGAIVGFGGLGNLIQEGLNSFFKSQVLVASLLCIVLAVIADVVLLALQRMFTPWKRGVTV